MELVYFYTSFLFFDVLVEGSLDGATGQAIAKYTTAFGRCDLIEQA